MAVAIELKGKKLGRVRLRRIADASANELNSFVEDFVQSGSVVLTDGWPSYAQLTKKGYAHKIISSTAALAKMMTTYYLTYIYSFLF